MHAQAADDLECHRQIRHTMERKNERNEGRKYLTFNTVACSLGGSRFSSLDHSVRAKQNRLRNLEVERTRGVEVYHQLKLG